MPLHDTYFVLGHFHATLFGGFVFPFFAAIYYWYPKITGRMFNETLGRIHFWVITPAFWLMSIGQMSVGVMGMRRRIADYDPALNVEFGHMLITISAFAIAFSVLLMVYNLFTSAEVGKLAGDNPWRSRSPEWQIPSPVPEHSYATPISVIGEPYDYGLANSTYIQMGTAGGHGGGHAVAHAGDD
jgi:cytochrome c oxidase subunit 1